MSAFLQYDNSFNMYDTHWRLVDCKIALGTMNPENWNVASFVAVYLASCLA